MQVEFSVGENCGGRRCPGHSKATSSMNGQKFYQVPALQSAPGRVTCGVFHDERSFYMIDHVTIRFEFFSPAAIPKPRQILRPGDKFGLHSRPFTSARHGLGDPVFREQNGDTAGMFLRGAPGWDFRLLTGRQHGQSVSSTGRCWRRHLKQLGAGTDG